MTTHRRFMVWLIWGAVIAALGLGAALWWRARQAPAASQYRTETLALGDLTQTASANGTLNPVVLVSVGTQVSGTVKVLRADFNDHVRAGQVLLELDPALLQAQARQSAAGVASAEAALTFATVSEARLRALLAPGMVARRDYDQSVQALQAARAQLQLAQAQLSKDRTNLANATIRSPVSGVVVDRQVELGQTVAANFQTPTLFRIAQDLRKMQIDSSFAEADIGTIRVGQAVRFNVDAFANRTFEGQVRQIRLNPSVQQNVVTYDVVVTVDNPEQLLMPGMTAYVNVVIARRQQVLLVPNAALRFKPAAAVAGAPAASGARGAAPAGADGAAAGARQRPARAAGRAVVYLLDGGALKPVAIDTGIADSRHTEALGTDLKAGQVVVVDDLRAAPAPPPAGGTMRMRMF
jgi:HlyD family secretion protein